nr:RNA-directed DNA polymerase, eukaryota, reverse transcriptase zinc-binding domain protein [Tanacetum cinerariifolium]
MKQRRMANKLRIDKSLGPDGFSFGFYRRYWNFLEKDVEQAVRYFFLHGTFPKGGNLSFIVLIPKTNNANMVRWDYLDDVLKNFGFGDKWRGWIQNCLKSSRGFVIVNGSPTNEFQFCRGLKQGDPLSPFLFLLIMESLHISVQRVVDANMFRGISIGTSIQFSHLFYADDVVFMGQWSDSNIETIVHVLECFHRASGLRINMNKSKIMGISVAKSIVEQAATRIGYAILTIPYSYLGSKVGDLMSRSKAWNDIINKLTARLSKWKMKTLSIGGD